MLDDATRACESCYEQKENQNQQSEMIMKIKSLNFSVIELALFLDTHPDDQKALFLHGKYSNELKVLKEQYQKIYGPLNFYIPCNKWKWIEEPWPWERRNLNVDL